MAQVHAQQIQDLVNATLRELGRLRFQQIAQEFTDYCVMNHWFQKDKVMFDSGHGIQRTLMARLPNVARHKGLLDKDTFDIPALTEQMTVDWVHADTNWSFVHQETLMNRGKELIFNVIAPRRSGALIDLIEELENKAWSLPASSNTTDPFGIPYWIVKNATTGFNGGLPSGHSTIAGISLTDAPTFKNYTAQYVSVTKTDLVKKMRTAHRKVRFKSPTGVEAKDYSNGRAMRYRLYANESTVANFEDIGEAQNENLGRDIASIDGVGLTFRRHPIMWAEKLDSDSTNPVYMLDHSVWYPVCLKGDYLRETPNVQVALQHNSYVTFVDLTYNFICVDRRRNAVLNTA